ncbi:MAG TPA: L,D-transpeptidase [Gemmatimonadaceae bacterium]|nr:L,D-transpeptidase [Gemmatimonadaceae bacterium]
MTNQPPHDDWDPGRRQDAARMRTDRRRVGWREFRHSYPGLVVTMAIAVAIFLAADAWLFVRYRRYIRETASLRASMTDVERKRTDALLAQEENRIKVMVELFKRQAKVDPKLHLSVSLDSGVMYLERDGALLREMPITVGPEKRVGTPPDTLHIAAPRGKRTVERLLDEKDAWPVPRWVYQDRGITPSDAPLAGALGPAAITLDGGTVIYSMPSAGPLNDSTYVLPGAIRVRASDLKAIAPNIGPGVAVYFY